MTRVREFVIEEWRWLLGGLLVTVVVAGLIFRPASPLPPAEVTQATPTSSSAATATQENAISAQERDAVVVLVFALEEALDSPPSPERLAALSVLSTPAGFASLGVSATQDASLASKASDVVVRVGRGAESIVQIHDFDDITVWADSNIAVTTRRNVEVVNTVQITRLSYWEKTSAGWKFVGFEKVARP